MNSSPTSFSTKDYFFELPSRLIAAQPIAQRDEARLLVVDRARGSVEHRQVKDLPDLLGGGYSGGYSIVANNTKVFRARLIGERVGTGGRVEFFILKRVGTLQCQGLMKAGAKIAPGFEFRVGEITGRVLARDETNAGAIFTAEFSADPVAAGVGEVPLPPYIQELVTDRSSERVLTEYNTLFAREDGSVASPTAGRHFTPELIARLRLGGADWNEITLHVGLGTFKPVAVADLREHQMHAEAATISESVARGLNSARAAGRRILAVGTTSTRTLEGFCSPAGSSGGGVKLESGTRDLDLFIYPGSPHQWRFVDAMMTNFHLPESTLLMMVSSFIGSRDRTLEIYREAIREGYRFYSYGDAMLIL